MNIVALRCTALRHVHQNVRYLRAGAPKPISINHEFDRLSHTCVGISVTCAAATGGNVIVSSKVWRKQWGVLYACDGAGMSTCAAMVGEQVRLDLT
jgi:hypothetical protein